MSNLSCIKKILLILLLTNSSTFIISQSLIAGWDFQTTTNGGTAMLGAPNTPTVLIANFGNATLYLDGSNGSSTWITEESIRNELTSDTGCYLNAGIGFSTITSGAASLVIAGGANNSANGKYMVFKFSMNGKFNLLVSYITTRTSTGFTSQIWEYSTDGLNWNSYQTITNLSLNTFALVTLNTVSYLDNAETAYLRLSATGASTESGKNKIDNIQFNYSYNQKLDAPTFSVNPGNVTSTQSIHLSCSTPGASIYYTTDGTTPNNTGSGSSILYNENAIAISSTTTLNATAYKTGMSASVMSTAKYNFPTIVTTVSDLRASSITGFYKLLSEAVITFQSTAGKVKFMQDATGGIVIRDNNSKIVTIYNVGDGIKNIYGTLLDNNGMLEMIPFVDPGVANSTGNFVSPKIVTLNNFKNYPSQLVTIKDVSITGTGHFVASTNASTFYGINDGTPGKLRVAYSDLPYVESGLEMIIPSANQDITGIVFNYSPTEVDLVPRSSDDFSPSPSMGTGIPKVDINLKVSISNGTIRFNCKSGKNIEIYNTIGQRLINKQTIEGLNTIQISAKGVVILKIENIIVKIFI